MTRIMMRWLAPAACIAVALYLLHLSYRAYAKWWENTVVIEDLSAAEAYEIEFWPEMVLAVTLLLLGGFLAGRRSKRR